MSEKGKHIASLAAAFLAGVVIAAIIAFILTRQQGSIAQQQEPAEQGAETVQQAEQKDPGPDAAQQAQPEEPETDQAGSAPVSGGDIDYAGVFPSWDPDSASLKELVDFVKDSTDETSKGYIDPADRIATFDMDGTVLCEKAPVYIDYCLTIYRVLDDPGYNATEEERNNMQQVRDHAYTDGETFTPEGINKDDLVALAFAGMTPGEFRDYVVDFADKTNVVGFEGMTYGQSFYKPMLEVIDFLRANDFDVWMVSACEREVVRALMERYDIPYDHVIATDVPYVASGIGDKEADTYNMSSEEEILLGEPLDEVECGRSAKPAAIAREIGKRPVLAFGNSAGDYSMLNYAEGNPDHPGMGFFVVCDDTEREYGSEKKAADYMLEVENNGWTPFSMANDWKTIYGEGVKRTELPGAVEAQPQSEEAQPEAEQEQPGAEEEQPGAEEEQSETEEELPNAA